MYGFNDNIGIDSKEALNQLISDEQIYALYLDEVVINEKIPAPRGEHNPSFELSYYDDNLVWRDFGWSVKPRDAVQFVQYLAEIEGKKLNYYQAIEKILNDMKNGVPDVKPVIRPGREFTDIRIKYRKKLRSFEIDYWASQKIPEDILRLYNVCSAELWINGRCVHYSRPKDPLFAYMFDENLPAYKLYRPYADISKKQRKFLEVDARDFIQGYNQVFDKDVVMGDSCVITKSQKDVMSYRVLSIPAVAPQGESEFLPLKVLKSLQKHYTNIYINYDPDEAGYRNSLIYSEKHKLPRIFFNEFLVKDLTEFRIEYDDDTVLEFLSKYKIYGTKSKSP